MLKWMLGGCLAMAMGVCTLSAAQDGARVWISKTGEATDTRIGLDVRFSEVQPASTPIVIEGAVTAAGPSGPVEIEAVVRNEAGAVVHTGVVGVEVESKSNPYQFTWPVKDLPDGEYSARLTLWRGRGGELAFTELEVLKLSRDTVDGMLSRAGDDLAALDDHLAGLGLDVPDSPYALLPLNIARDALSFGKRIEQDWPRVRNIALYIEKACERYRARLTFGRAPLEWEVWATPPDMGDVAIKDGTYYAGDRPVFLGGLVAGEDPAAAIGLANRYGLGLVSVDYNGRPSTEPAAVLAEAADANVGVHYALRLLPEDRTTGLEASATPVAAGAAATQAAADRIAALAGSPYVVAASLASNPVFHLDGPHVQNAFAQAMELRYEEYYRMNWAWKTRIVDFASAPIWFEYDHPAYQYDWQKFHQDLVTTYVESMTGRARQIAPGVPLAMGLDEEILSPFHTTFGVDEERLLRKFDATVIEASMSPEDEFFGIGFPRETLLYALLRSFAPENPILNVQPGTPQPSISREHGHRLLRTIVWEGAIEGLSGLALNGWSAEPDGPASFASTPEGLEGYVSAVYDVNRLADVVLAFQRAPAEMGILWSDSSRIHRGGAAFLSSVARAFEGISFSGMKVRFVTESQIAAGAYDDLRVLVVPEAPAISDSTFAFIENFTREHNGVIIRAAKPMPYNSWGLSREEVITYEGAVLLVRGEDVPTEYLDATDAAAYEKKLDATPRPINTYRYPLEGVRMRYVEHEGASYLYAVNLRNETVHCHLSTGPATGVDLITGRPARFPRMLPALTPVLLRLDAPAVELELAAEQTDGGNAVPTAEIRVPEPPAPTEEGIPDSARRRSPKR